MPNIPTTPEEAVKLAEEHLDRSLDRLETSLDPVWRAQSEMTRTLVTLAAGAFVITLSLVQLLAQSTTPRLITWKWALPASWVLFCVTIVAGTLRHGLESSARSMRLRFEFRRADVRQAVRAIPIGVPNYADRWDQALALALTKAAEEPDRAIRAHNALTHVCVWSFIAGTVALLAFAIRNLPF